MVPEVKNFCSLFLIGGITKLLKWANHALNFFCYCIAGKRFRQELVAMVKSIFCFHRKKLSKSAEDVGETTAEISVPNHV